MNTDITKIWPGWTITERLGHGGFGHVYKATYAETDAVAAVKVITIPDNPDIIEDLRYSGRIDDEILTLCHEEAERMMEEIKVMQKLKGSANIVSIEDSALREKEDSIGYDIYIRMEHLTPLKKHIPEISPLTDEIVVKIGCDICSALEICHKKTANKRQIIHRDIKPDNILYHELSDAYKLGDFGIARERFDTTNTLTRGIGTARFIAPEVEAGTAYDHRADLYSLGLLLYFLRNRERLPFEYLGQVVDDTSVSRAKWKRVHGDEPIPPPIDASPALAEVILKACAYAPQDRYASAADMKDALLKTLRNPNRTTSQAQTAQAKTVPSSPVNSEPVKEDTKQKKNKKGKLILGVIVAVAILFSDLPWILWDLFEPDTVQEDSISGESTNTDPETLADPVDGLMIEDTTDTEEPAGETINTAIEVPTEEETQETNAETVPPAETESIDITSPAAVFGGASQEEASPINLEVTYTFDGSNGNQGEEWYKFQTSSSPSVYFFTVAESSSSGMIDYTIYDIDLKEITHDGVDYGEEEQRLLLQSDTEYWVRFQNPRSCTYTFTMTEQLRDGGMTRKEAHPIALETAYDKTIEIQNLADWYKFTTTENNAVYRFTLDTQIGESLIHGYTDLTLYDADGIKIKECSSFMDYDFFDILLEPSTDYFIRIQGENTINSIGDYRFSVSERICDAGTDHDSAAVLEYGKRYTGTINSTLSDWYQIEMPAAGKYIFKLHNIDTGARITVNGKKEPADADPFYSSLANEDSYSRSFHVKEGAVLYLEICSDAYNANGTYIFEILPEE